MTTCRFVTLSHPLALVYGPISVSIEAVKVLSSLAVVQCRLPQAVTDESFSVLAEMVILPYSVESPQPCRPVALTVKFISSPALPLTVPVIVPATGS